MNGITEVLSLMKPDLVITVIIFVLLFIKLGKEINNDALLPVIQVLLLLNFITGFFWNSAGSLFYGMYHTDPLIAIEKSILSLAVYLVSLLFNGWFRKTEHLSEFFILMLSALLGMNFMISSGNFLMF